jgi:hypothetical protein
VEKGLGFWLDSIGRLGGVSGSSWTRSEEEDDSGPGWSEGGEDLAHGPGTSERERGGLVPIRL